MVSGWLGMREMQARRAQTNTETKEVVMANRAQKGNREKKKPKKDKPKDAPVFSSFGRQPKPSGQGK